jgi:flagellar hook-associated protein 1
MPSTFGSLNIALRGLMSMQRAIEITGHNVTNASSTGYSRQSAVLAATPPDSFPAVNRNASIGQVGTGVMVEKVQRYRSEYLDTQIHNENLYLNGWKVRNDVLQQIEVILNEPSDTSLSANMDAFWSAWQDLATTPDSTAARAQVAETADNMSTCLREMCTQLADLQTELDHRVRSQVETINGLVT